MFIQKYQKENHMFIAIYRFKIHAGMEADFIHAWKVRTEGIYLLLGSLGSRLHKETKTDDYIGYAQWPTQELWENAQFELLNSDTYPDYKKAGEMMKKTIKHSETILELEVEADYLHKFPFAFI